MLARGPRGGVVGEMVQGGLRVHAERRGDELGAVVFTRSTSRVLRIRQGGPCLAVDEAASQHHPRDRSSGPGCGRLRPDRVSHQVDVGDLQQPDLGAGGV